MCDKFLKFLLLFISQDGLIEPTLSLNLFSV